MKRAPDAELAGMGFEDRYEAIVESWRSVSLNDAKAQMPALNTVKAYGDTPVNFATLKPDHDDIDDTKTIVRFSEYLNGYNPVQWIGAEVTRQLVAPNSRMIMMPNNSFRQANHVIPADKDAKELFANDPLITLARGKMTVLDYIDQNKFPLGKLGLTGWSFGANLALAIASLDHRQLEVESVNADETVSKTARTTKELDKDFLKSGNPLEQIRAGKESGIPATNQAFNFFRLPIDYAKFIKESLFSSEAKQIKEGMTGDVKELVRGALKTNPDIRIKLGHIAGSLIFDPASIAKGGIRVVKYDGDTNRRHASVNNPLVQAWMAHDGLIG